MLGERQVKEIELRICKTVNEFLKNPEFSDYELASKLNDMGIKTSSSTVGRDLNSKRIEEIFGKAIADKIVMYREQNKKRGEVIGGKNSQEKHSYEKDEKGHFIGSGRKK